jgi:hypothetical protein
MEPFSPVTAVLETNLVIVGALGYTGLEQRGGMSRSVNFRRAALAGPSSAYGSWRHLASAMRARGSCGDRQNIHRLNVLMGQAALLNLSQRHVDADREAQKCGDLPRRFYEPQ